MPRPRSRWPASTSSSAPIWTRPWRSPPSTRWRSSAWSRSGRSGRTEALADDAVKEAVATAWSQEWGRVVAAVIRLPGDWDLAEECAQDAFERALERWPRDGVPHRPGAWLTTTA